MAGANPVRMVNDSDVANRGRLFSGRHHARYIDETSPIHVVSRVFQGRHLLRPCPELNSIIVGVLGRALALYDKVDLYAIAVLSNHFHMMIQGPPTQVPAFIGFIKREISRRWGHRPEVGWHGTMWHEYYATGLPTEESQEHCLKYILSQGVKEGLVKRPQDWPGVHCADSLTTGSTLRGTWMNATGYSRALDAASRTRATRVVRKQDYTREFELALASIPAWAGLDAKQRQERVKRLIEEIVAEGEAARAHRPPLGRRRIATVPLARRTDIPKPPWMLRRRRMICWASATDPQTVKYVSAYWQFQESFRLSATRDRDRRPAFPCGSFAPGKWTTGTVSYHTAV